MNAIYVVFDVESKEVKSLHETYVDAFKEQERLKEQERIAWWDRWNTKPRDTKPRSKIYYTEELRVGNKWQRVKDEV